MDSIALYRVGDYIRPIGISGTPPSIVAEGHKYTRWDKTLGDYNYVRNKQKELIGFSFDVSKYELKIVDAMIHGAKNVTINAATKSNELIFLFSDALHYYFDCVQASSSLYRNKDGKLVISLHQWSPLGKLGFKLLTSEQSQS